MSSGILRMTSKVWSHPANEGRRFSQLAQAVRFQVRGRVLGIPTTIRVGERSRMSATLDSSASILAAYAPQPDYAEWQVWRQFLRPGDLFVDVGANIGTYSVLACEAGASVIAVEPDPSNVARLRRNLDLNGYDAEVWNVALTDEATMLTFTDDLDSMNHIAAKGGGRNVRGEQFDTLIGDRRVRGMKIDVEGAERLVLAGASESLTAGRIDLLQIEWNECARTNFDDTRERLAALLDAHGYHLYRPDSSGVLSATDASEGSDVFAARPEAL